MDSDDRNPSELPSSTIPSVRNGSVVRELIEYKREVRYLNSHYNGSLFWPDVPYEADTGICLDHYHKLELFTRLFPHNPTLVHRSLMLPVTATSGMRRVVYRMFI